MAAVPIATTVSVLEVLQKLDSEFASMARAFESGEFALWVGAGISRRAPSLGDLIARAINHLREKVNAGADPKYQRAFSEALALANMDFDTVKHWMTDRFEDWPNYKTMRDTLWTKYSDLLDVRLQDEDDDYMLWTAVDVREAFRSPSLPACEHLCIAILILEGAVSEVVSANWDGFIEAAVDRLGGIAGNLQIVVDPAHLRFAPGRARLLKFHGCIVHATDDPATYRNCLTANKTQITNWPLNAAVAAMRAEVESAATNLKALMVGLSLQDGNLQFVFAKARTASPWPWPSAPNAQAHVFCEETIGPGQRQMLKTVYAANYNKYVDEIERSAHLRAWAEQVLLALVLKLVADKLAVLIECSLDGKVIASGADELVAALNRLRDSVASLATGDRTAFANNAISVWSRMISIFRKGSLPVNAGAYEVISVSGVNQLGSDQNARAAGLGELAIALALLERGQNAHLWELRPPVDDTLPSGCLVVTAAWDGAKDRTIFLVRTASVALHLEQQGAFANDNTIVIHADDAWHQLRPTGTSTARKTSRAPGRTGAPETRHVSIAHLVNSEADVDALDESFVARVAI